MENTKVIFDGIEDKLFTIRTDESNDISNNEQIFVDLCYVNKYGRIVERFLGVVHDKTTTTI